MVFSQEKSGKITFFQHYIAHFLHFSNFSEMVLWGYGGKQCSRQRLFYTSGIVKKQVFRTFSVVLGVKNRNYSVVLGC